MRYPYPEDHLPIVIEMDDYRFVYHGGPFIDIYTAKGFRPFHAINVWDYEKDKPTIKCRPSAVLRKVEDEYDYWKGAAP